MSNLSAWTKIEYAVILRVPMSGDAELDAMIREARRLDMATAAISSFCTVQLMRLYKADENTDEFDKTVSKRSFDIADALLAASEPKESLRDMTEADFDAVHEFAAAPDAEGWIEWSGGECPVPDEARVEVRLRIGEIIGDIASEFIWGHEDDDFSDGDIIAYRVVK